MTDDNIIECLAALEHLQWWQWAETLMKSEAHLSTERVERWKKLMVPYAQLTEEQKEADRIWARRSVKTLEALGVL
jgi:hypothetical protein